ncbi:MAG: ATP-binding cassette domain-containing protein [Clostridiales bacterium]|jgi:putative ABC transport system ATP-binding protein|nr:ATP-binding cassette domain-containing protein [Clostridiales bacterium]
MLEIRNIHKTYNPGTVRELGLFDGFSLSVEAGQFLSIVGSNGSGKTTLLNILCGSIPVDAGQILLDGQDITRQKEHLRSRRMARIYQNPAMGTCAKMTIQENMALADNKFKRMNLLPGTDKARIPLYREMLSELGLGLENMMQARAGSLSGGQRQALAMTMARLAPIEFLVLDEHTAALDPKAAEVIMELTDRMVKQHKLTAIMVTHNLRFALDYGDRLLMMHQGQAVLDAAGDEKKALRMENLLSLFNEISIECGN